MNFMWDGTQHLHTHKRRCHSGCIVHHRLFLRHFCCFYLQMLSRSQQAGIWPAICFQPSHGASCHQRSLALSSTVHIQAHWGRTQPEAMAPHWVYRFLTHSCSCFLFNSLTTSTTRCGCLISHPHCTLHSANTGTKFICVQVCPTGFKLHPLSTGPSIRNWKDRAFYLGKKEWGLWRVTEDVSSRSDWHSTAERCGSGRITMQGKSQNTVKLHFKNNDCTRSCRLTDHWEAHVLTTCCVYESVWENMKSLFSNIK